MSSASTGEVPGQKARRFKFPTALTVLALVLLVVWLASFVIPSGAYDLDPETRAPLPGTYHELPKCTDDAAVAPCIDKSLLRQFDKLWDAPPSGLYGVENETGFVGGDEVGVLYGSAKIFLFVLAVGAFITVTMKTGAIETGIGRLALRFQNSP
ncbi:MAG TPA: YfcC family protein, partial [Dehalococcoidia bacterium]